MWIVRVLFWYMYVCTEDKVVRELLVGMGILDNNSYK
jgi:hypothetical protein